MRLLPAPPARLGELELSPARRALGRSTVTYHMNRLQSLRAEREFCVTLNRTESIDPADVIRASAYAHPVFTAEGVQAQARVDEISGRNRTHFCGAYWGWGFHEDGVVSALRVGSASERGCERQLHLRGDDSPPALRAPAASSAIAWRSPISTSRSSPGCLAAD